MYRIMEDWTGFYNYAGPKVEYRMDKQFEAVLQRDPKNPTVLGMSSSLAFQPP